jgi:hypothetical protein
MQADLARCDGEHVSNRLGAVVCDAAAEQVQDPLHVSLHLPRATLKRANACCTMRNVLGPLRRCINVCDPRRRCNRWGRPDVCRTAGAGARQRFRLHAAAPRAQGLQRAGTDDLGDVIRRRQLVRRHRALVLACPPRAAQCRCRCGGGEPDPGADVAGVTPVPVQMWRG